MQSWIGGNGSEDRCPPGGEKRCEGWMGGLESDIFRVVHGEMGGGFQKRVFSSICIFHVRMFFYR